MVSQKALANLDPEQKDAALLELLGEADFNAVKQIRTRRSERDRSKRIETLAQEMCTAEGGKFFSDYTEADNRARAIYEEAMQEAEAQVNEEDGIATDDDDDDEDSNEAAPESEASGS